jgi:uncharacterized protein YjbJ (UPF0337 family)
VVIDAELAAASSRRRLPAAVRRYDQDVEGEEATMSADDKMRGKANAASGRAKQRLGEATGDPRLAREGHAQRRRGNLRLALEKLKDAFRR